MSVLLKIDLGMFYLYLEVPIDHAERKSFNVSLVLRRLKVEIFS